MSEHNRARILVIEDNPKTSRTLGLFLAAEGYGVDFASSGQTGEALFHREEFDLVVLDLMLPDKNGLQVCKSICVGTV